MATWCQTYSYLRWQVAGGAARFTFAQLCKTLMAAADYQALARRFHTLFVTGIPAMSFAVGITNLTREAHFVHNSRSKSRTKPRNHHDW